MLILSTKTNEGAEIVARPLLFHHCQPLIQSFTADTFFFFLLQTHSKLSESLLILSRALGAMIKEKGNKLAF